VEVRRRRNKRAGGGVSGGLGPRRAFGFAQWPGSGSAGTRFLKSSAKRTAKMPAGMPNGGAKTTGFPKGTGNGKGAGHRARRRRGCQGTIPRPRGGAMTITSGQASGARGAASRLGRRSGRSARRCLCLSRLGASTGKPPPLAVWAWSAKRCDCPSRPPASRAPNKHKRRSPVLNKFLASGHRAWQARRGHGKQHG